MSSGTCVVPVWVFLVAKFAFAGDLQLPGVASFSKLKSTKLSKQLCILDKRVFLKIVVTCLSPFQYDNKHFMNPYIAGESRDLQGS